MDITNGGTLVTRTGRYIDTDLKTNSAKRWSRATCEDNIMTAPNKYYAEFTMMNKKSKFYWPFVHPVIGVCKPGTGGDEGIIEAFGLNG